MKKSSQVKPLKVNMPHVFRDVMKAIVRRNDAALTELLTKAPEVVDRTGPHPEWGGRPQALHVAIETGNVFAFEVLLKAGASVDGENGEYDGWSPLMLAVHWKRDDFRDELIRRGARIGLIEALMLRDDRRVAVMLKEPGLLKQEWPNQATPLHFARTVKSARLLIQLGVDPGANDKYFRTAMQRWDDVRPRSAGMRNLAATLVKELVVPDLFKAVESGKAAEVRKMLAAGSDVNARFAKGSQGTLLHAAAWNGDLRMVKILCEQGADVHAVDREHGTTVLVWARHAEKAFDRQKCGPVARYLEKQMGAKKG